MDVKNFSIYHQSTSTKLAMLKKEKKRRRVKYKNLKYRGQKELFGKIKSTFHNFLKVLFSWQKHKKRTQALTAPIKFHKSKI